MVAVVHRFERLRLVLLGLERYLSRGEPYAPHDADKHVNRDFGAAAEALLAPTFCTLDAQAALGTFRSLHAGISQRLERLAPSPALTEEFWEARCWSRRTGRGGNRWPNRRAGSARASGLARTSAPLLRPRPCWTRPSCDLGFRGAWDPMAGALLGPVQRRWARLDGCHPGGTSRNK